MEYQEIHNNVLEVTISTIDFDEITPDKEKAFLTINRNFKQIYNSTLY